MNANNSGNKGEWEKNNGDNNDMTDMNNSKSINTNNNITTNNDSYSKT